MTTDELRQAAEDVRDSAAAWLECNRDPDERDEEDVAFWRKQLAVATAWLADHPADDAEPVTSEWIESLGFIRSFQYPATLRRDEFYIRNVSGQWEPFFEVGLRQIQRMAACSTRGHVRRLLAALGITTTPPIPPASGVDSGHGHPT